METVSKRQSAVGRLALVGATLVWGTSFVILKNTLNDIPTMYILAVRFTGAALLMGLAGFRELKKLDWGYVKYGALMGIFIFVAYAFQTYGLLYTTPGKNAFLTAAYCILVPFLYWPLCRVRPDRYNVAAAAAGFAGVGLVSLDAMGSVNIGDMLTVCCGVFFALHIITVAKYGKGRSTVLITMVQFAVSGVLSWAGALIFEQPPVGAPASAWISVAYLCVMCTAACFFLQIFGQKYTPPSAAALLLTLESVFGAAVSVVFYHEKLSFRLLLGFALIFAAVVVSESKLSFLKPKARRAAAPQGACQNTQMVQE